MEYPWSSPHSSPLGSLSLLGVSQRLVGSVEMCQGAIHPRCNGYFQFFTGSNQLSKSNTMARIKYNCINELATENRSVHREVSSVSLTAW